MTQLHHQFLTKNEKPEYVILPYEEFVELQESLEDLEDLVDLRNARNEEEHEPSSFLENVKKELEIS